MDKRIRIIAGGVALMGLNGVLGDKEAVAGGGEQAETGCRKQEKCVSRPTWNNREHDHLQSEHCSARDGFVQSERSPPQPRALGLLSFQLQRGGVDAVAIFPRGLRAIGKDVTEMPSAPRAGDFRAHHAVTDVFVLFDIFFLHGR